MNLIQSQLWEIKRSPSLRFLGVLLFVAHICTYFLWFTEKSELYSLALAGSTQCWSFFPNCQSLSNLFSIQWIFYAYVGLSAVGILLFAIDRLLNLAWYFLFICFVIYFSALTLNSSFFSNIHVLLGIANLGFLFIPNKIHFFPKLFLFYFVFEGLLKVNPDWLSGFWLKQQFADWIDLSTGTQKKLKALEWVAAFGIVIEVIAPVFLFTRAGQQLIITSSILIFYFIIQWVLTPFFTPVIMLLVVLFFIIYFFEKDQKARESIYQSFSRPEPTSLWSWVVLLLFFAIQLPPHFTWSKSFNFPLTLKPAKIPPECKQYTFVNFKNKLSETEFNISSTSPFYCQSQFHFKLAQSLCHKYEGKDGFEGVSSYFLSRGFSEKKFKTVFEENNVCNNNITMKKEGSL